MATNTDGERQVAMKRFWFCTYQTDVKFHTSMNCPGLNRLPEERNREDLAVAHIPVDSDDVGNKSKLDFCGMCGTKNPYE